MNTKLFTTALLLCGSLGLTAYAHPLSMPSNHQDDTSHRSTAVQQHRPRHKTTIPRLPHLPHIASPQGADNDDTINTYRIIFSDPINEIVLEDFCNLTVVPDSTNFLTYSNPSKRDNNIKAFSYKFTNRGVLKIEGLAQSKQLELHLDIGNGLTIETNDFSNARVHINQPLALLSLKANDYSNIFVMTDGDSIRATTLSIVTNDFSNAFVKSPVATATLKMKTNDFSNVHLADGDAIMVFQQQNDESTIHDGNLRSGTTYIDFDEEMEVARPASKPVTTKPSIFREGGWEFDFGWAFTNWGREPWSGLNSVSGSNALGTTFSSYQLELVYHPLCTKHFQLGIGLGYGSNIYRFNAPYVTLATPLDDSPARFAAIDRTDGQWASRMVARYVTLPVSITWTPKAFSDFSIGLAAIPGVNYTSGNTGLKHQGENPANRGKTSDVENLSAVMNPLQLDARLSLNYSHISVFVQMATLPVMKNFDEDLYPIKLGFTLRLFND
ncbi:MAG: hypothetical protein IJ785_00365 [Bacteroidales bacterium]|nr:hypothetical protein [Bacteroidales bacterium]